MRLGVVIFLCFVMPHFQGAHLAYQGSVRFLLKLLQVVVIDRVHNKKEGRVCRREMHLNVVKRHIQEYGSRFLGRHAASQVSI